jgi:hypothetical protein
MTTTATSGFFFMDRVPPHMFGLAQPSGYAW